MPYSSPYIYVDLSSHPLIHLEPRYPIAQADPKLTMQSKMDHELLAFLPSPSRPGLQTCTTMPSHVSLYWRNESHVVRCHHLCRSSSLPHILSVTILSGED